jgi:DNA-binding winged helix-turn-helix (wHTH) protein
MPIRSEVIPVEERVRMFHGFEFDEKVIRLRRASGIVTISGQCLDLLVLLLDRSGQLATPEG